MDTILHIPDLVETLFLVLSGGLELDVSRITTATLWNVVTKLHPLFIERDIGKLNN